MPLSFSRETVRVLRAPMRESRGSQVPDWERAEEHEVSGCLLTARATSQDRDGRALQVTSGLTLRAPYGSDVMPGDRVIARGELYEVDGEVFHTESPAGRASSTRCALARWEG